MQQSINGAPLRDDSWVQTHTCKPPVCMYTFTPTNRVLKMAKICHFLTPVFIHQKTRFFTPQTGCQKTLKFTIFLTPPGGVSKKHEICRFFDPRGGVPKIVKFHDFRGPPPGAEICVFSIKTGPPRGPPPGQRGPPPGGGPSDPKKTEKNRNLARRGCQEIFFDPPPGGGTPFLSKNGKIEGGGQFLKKSRFLGVPKKCHFLSKIYVFGPQILIKKNDKILSKIYHFFKHKIYQLYSIKF